MIGPHKAIVIAAPRNRRQSLCALLRSMPEIGEILESDTPQDLHPEPVFSPSLILIDCWSSNAIESESISQLKKYYPQTPLLALVNQSNHAPLLSIIDAMLIEGYDITLFFETIRTLLKKFGVQAKIKN